LLKARNARHDRQNENDTRPEWALRTTPGEQVSLASIEKDIHSVDPQLARSVYGFKHHGETQAGVPGKQQITGGHDPHRHERVLNWRAKRSRIPAIIPHQSAGLLMGVRSGLVMVLFMEMATCPAQRTSGAADIYALGREPGSDAPLGRPRRTAAPAGYIIKRRDGGAARPR